jgi:hypothetical protein
MRFPRIILTTFIIVLAATLGAQAPPWTCPGNLVADASFNQAVGAIWQVAYGTPQISPAVTGGCNGTLGYASMWGNANTTIGEGLTQPVTLVAGTTYAIEFCGRYRPLSPVGPNPYVNLVVRASVGALSSAACTGPNCTVAMSVNNVTSQGWTTYRGCFTPTKNYDHITLSPSNNSTVNDGAQVSWGEFDNFCIRPVTPPVITGPADSCVLPATYCVTPAQAVTWSATGANFVNVGGGCIQVNAFTSSAPTISATTQPGPNGCPVTVTRRIRPCARPNCCGDINLTAQFSPPQASTTPGAVSFTTTLGGMSSVTRVDARVVSASHSYSPGCGTAGPIAVSFPQTQPSSAGWNPPVVPILSGQHLVWTPGTPVITLPSNLRFDMLFPPGPGSFNCTETITVCIEFEVTARVPTTGVCRSCKIIRCFTFSRRGGTE